MRNPIGFIPRDHELAENDGDADEIHTLMEMWNVRQLAEALETDQMLRDSREDLFEQVCTYADQLENLDPDNHNAAQEIGKAVVTLSYAETAQDRLDALIFEAQRLMLAIAEVKRQRADGAKLLTKLRHLAPGSQGFFDALIWAGCLLVFVLTVIGR